MLVAGYQYCHAPVRGASQRQALRLPVGRLDASFANGGIQAKR